MPGFEYKGHTIWVSFKPTANLRRWNCFILVFWNRGLMQQRLIRLTCDEREFETAHEARREGFEFAKKWIDAGNTGVFEERTGSDNRKGNKRNPVI